MTVTAVADLSALAGRIVERGVPSEAIEPATGVLVAFWYASCDVAGGDRLKLEDACQALWMGLLGLQKIAVATPSAVHFGVVVGNEMRRAARYIEQHLGVRPLEQWKW